MPKNGIALKVNSSKKRRRHVEITSREIDNGWIVSRWDDKNGRNIEIYAADERAAKDVMVRLMAGKA